MRHKRLKLSVVLLLGLGLTGLHAQEKINTTGGNASGSGGSVNYSVGQVVFQTHTGTTGSVSEGIQQPYEISLVTGIEEAKGINLTIAAYPNPATDYLTLSVDELDYSNLSYRLYDMNGNLLQNKIIFSGYTQVIMNDLVPASYLLKVFENNKEIKTFKIIKTQ